MKNFVLLALLAGAGWFGYPLVLRMQQESCYRKVADAWAIGQTDEALRYTECDAVRKSLEEHPLRSLVDGRMIEAWRGVTYRIESSSREEGGDVALEAKQRLAFDPPGITSAIGGAMWVSFHHSVKLRRTGEGWRVVAFTPKFLDFERVPRR
jgi:hypothetical protein